MNTCQLTLEEMELLAVTLTQLDDTLATIAVQKNSCANISPKH